MHPNSTLPELSPDQITRFWAKVRKSDDPNACWEWQGKRLPKGYGQWQVEANYQVTYVLSHRIAYTLTHGSIPDDLIVCHHCDNPPCCNPAHLYAGTQSDNRNDAYRRGRRSGYAGPRYHGDDHPNRKHPERMARKLTAEQVIDARTRYAAGETQTALARELGVSQGIISSIILRKTWRHVP